MPVERHAAVKARLPEVKGLTRSEEEPSIWLPKSPELLEVNFIGMDAGSGRAGETYVFEDAELPLLVLAGLSKELWLDYDAHEQEEKEQEEDMERADISKIMKEDAQPEVEENEQDEQNEWLWEEYRADYKLPPG